MTEDEWLRSSDPDNLFRHRDRLTERKARLFACSCCRRIWHLLTDVRSRRAVEVAEAYAEGKAGRAELSDASRQAEVAWKASKNGQSPHCHSAEAATRVAILFAAL